MIDTKKGEITTGNMVFLNIEIFRKLSPQKLGKMDFAKSIGVRQDDYSKWINRECELIKESGGDYLSENSLFALDQYFKEYNVSVEWLFTKGTISEFLKVIPMNKKYNGSPEPTIEPDKPLFSTKFKAKKK